MTDALLDEYLASVRPDAHGAVRALAAAVDAAGADFDCAIKYGLLMYTFDARWHRWVVAIGVTKKVVSLRFLFADRLTDPAGLLRFGTSTAASIDYASAAEVDPSAVTSYVNEAVAKHDRG